MISDRDIWTAANEVMKSHDDPLLHAAERIGALREQGDSEGCEVWKRIATAIQELMCSEPEGKVS